MTSNLASREIAAHALQLRREAEKAAEKAKSKEGKILIISMVGQPLDITCRR